MQLASAGRKKLAFLSTNAQAHTNMSPLLSKMDKGGHSGLFLSILSIEPMQANILVCGLDLHTLWYQIIDHSLLPALFLNM